VPGAIPADFARQALPGGRKALPRAARGPTALCEKLNKNSE
jgi:hypothetical protein